MIRWFDIVGSAFGLLLLSPLLAVIAVAVILGDGFPVLFRQIRIGRGGKPFELLKFRSMIENADGRAITAAGDGRITRVGRFLRRYKLDELPQLWNVLKGDMSLVGPRPEVPRYVDIADPVWRSVLTVRPGITDYASLLYRNEEDILAESACPETYYRTILLPAKLNLNLQYIERYSFFTNLRLILVTILSSASPQFRPAQLASMQIKGPYDSIVHPLSSAEHRPRGD